MGSKCLETLPVCLAELFPRTVFRGALWHLVFAGGRAVVNPDDFLLHRPYLMTDAYTDR